MRKALLATAILASLGFAAKADAYTITISSASNWAMFDDIVTGSSNFTDNGLDFSGTGMVQNGSVTNMWAAPAGDTSNYMAVLKGELETITFPTAQSSLLIYWGSIDGKVGENNDNMLTFSNGTVISGSTLVSMGLALGNGNQKSPLNNEWVLISGLDPFSSVTATSTGNSFEFDMATAVPEGSTWGMLVLGFAGLGYAAFRKSSKDRLSLGAI